MDDIPSYWKEYLENKAESLRIAESSLGNTGVSFAFITDVHIKTNNLKSPALLRCLFRNKLIRKVVCGGDIVYESYADKENALLELSSWADSTSQLRMVTILGNHDLNTHRSKDPMQAISESQFYQIECERSSSFVNYVKGTLYGYEDDTDRKVRYIYLNTGAPDEAVIDDIQIEWMKQCVLSLDKGWSVIVFCHQFFTGRMGAIPKLYIDANGVAIEGALNSIYDRSQATIACVVTGHCHRNYSKYSEKGFPIIATTCDTGGPDTEYFDPDTPYRVAGTTEEQAFDIYYVNTEQRRINIIRIGAGDSFVDRTFDY